MRVDIELPNEVSDKLHIIAGKINMPENDIVIESVRLHLIELEQDVEDFIEAEKVLNSNESTITLKEVLKKYDMEC